MTARPRGSLRVWIARRQAAERSARAKTLEVLGEPDLSERALLKRQRAAQRAIAEALGGCHGAAAAREIAFHVSDWFDEAAFLVALRRDPKKFSTAEIEAGVSDVLAHVLDHVWEAARVAGFPLPCREDETPGGYDDEEDI
jgi:hypothetical protein